ncbi:VOC family protein [Streptomyces sp. NPDC091972]|uniref:VOC family protein n=1 Tax=Streptomyces sp. NPDC091972 TaxID=3366007 RepID=UPI00382A2012
MLSPPLVSGLHHVTLPVTDLEVSTDWYTRVLGAERLPELDHHDDRGFRYSVVLFLPGLTIPIQLRLAPEAAGTATEFDPVTFAVADSTQLDHWETHLRACNVSHSPVVKARIGHALSFHDPDGTMLRLYTEPAGGLGAITQGG